MAISKQRMLDYTNALSELARRAKLDVRATFELYESLGFKTALRETIAAAQLAAEVYGDMAATVAAELYEEVALEEIQKIISASLANPYDYAQLEDEINYVAHNHLFDGSADTDGFKTFVDSIMEKVVKQPARDTIINNAARDVDMGVRFARVPMGKNPCAWCRMAASRGFVYYTEESAEALGKYHNGRCHCEIVPSWENSPRVAGYDRQKYLDEYYNARKESESSMPNVILQQMRKDCNCK